jgi:hypothetical protein
VAGALVEAGSDSRSASTPIVLNVDDPDRLAVSAQIKIWNTWMHL